MQKNKCLLFQLTSKCNHLTTSPGDVVATLARQEKRSKFCRANAPKPSFVEQTDNIRWLLQKKDEQMCWRLGKETNEMQVVKTYFLGSFVKGRNSQESKEFWPTLASCKSYSLVFLRPQFHSFKKKTEKFLQNLFRTRNHSFSFFFKQNHFAQHDHKW